MLLALTRTPHPNQVYDRSLFQRPLLPAGPTVPPPRPAGSAGAAAVPAGMSAPARDAWAWAQQRGAPMMEPMVEAAASGSGDGVGASGAVLG